MIELSLYREIILSVNFASYYTKQLLNITPEIHVALFNTFFVKRNREVCRFVCVFSAVSAILSASIQYFQNLSKSLVMNLIWCQNIAMKYEKYYIAFEKNDSYHVMKYDVLYSKKNWNIPPHPWYMSLFSTMTPPWFMCFSYF